MKFVTLDLRNWRSFHGDNHIDFSTDPERPVTLLLGPNGAGKTALLNAFTWVIYGQFTEGFDHPDQLVNLEAAEIDASAETVVELLLHHQEDEFRVKRATNVQRQGGDGDWDLTVTKNGHRAVEDDLHRILPPPLKDLFFFPAETFSTASVLKGENPGEGTSIDVGTAIRALLSGDIYDHAFKDLGQAIESNALKPPRNYRDETLEAARRKFEQAQADLNAAEERRDSLPREAAQAREQAAKAKHKAERYNPDEMKKWQRRHKELDSAVKNAEQGVELAQSLYVELARSVHMHFAQCAVASGIGRLDLAETAGLMPPRIHENVLEMTLRNHKCSLCGEELTDNGEVRVTSLRERVADAEVAIRGVEIRTMLRQYTTRHLTELDLLREEIASVASRFRVDPPPRDADLKILGSVLRTCIDLSDRLLAHANQEFDEFSENSDGEHPTDGQNPVEIAMVKQGLVDRLESEMASIDNKVDNFTVRARDLFADYQTKSGKTKDHARKTSAISILQEAKRFFGEAKKGLEKFGREDFERAINETFSDLVKRELDISVGQDFSIRVYRSGTKDLMPLAQSEKVLLLIAFLGAIARLAPHYEQIAQSGNQLARTGRVDTSQKQGFPVVLDSPTSPLDKEYEIEVVSALPRLLPQIVIPVSAKSVSVWEEISKHVGATYVMQLTSRSATNRKVSWNGKDHVYSTQDDGVTPGRTHISRID